MSMIDEKVKTVAITIVTSVITTIVVIYLWQGFGGLGSGQVSKIKETPLLPENGQTPIIKDVQNYIAPISPGSSQNFHRIAVKVSGKKFDPNTFTVKSGDVIHLDITSTDGDYDFSLPQYTLNYGLPEDRSIVVEFQAIDKGEFQFYCASCGGEAGRLIVE
jgi:heme/copper-type cytochrome/quinol oxidase subunit 2